MDRVARGASDFRHARRSRSPTRRAALGAVVEPAAGDAGFIGWSDAPARGRCQPAVPVFALAVPDSLRGGVCGSGSSAAGRRPRIGEDRADVCVPFGRSVDLHCLLRPAKSELREYVREFHPHVLHFAGHGGVDGQNAALLFDAPAGTWPWSSAQIASDLAGWQWTPAFVFLNACRSGFGAQSSWSVQRTFMSAGVQASLGMQVDMPGQESSAAPWFRPMSDMRSHPVRSHAVVRWT
jgi:hypothetical protein